MSSSDFTIGEPYPSLPAADVLDQFILRRAYDTGYGDNQHVAEGFIEQKGAPGERATCMIASRLNGLIGLGAIATSDAEAAHNDLATSDAFRWTYLPSKDLYFPMMNIKTLAGNFNQEGLLPVSVEFSPIYRSAEIPRHQLVSLVGRAGNAHVGVILSRSDIGHDIAAIPTPNAGELLVVDSRRPDTPLVKDPEQIVDYLNGDDCSDIQLMHEGQRSLDIIV
ncbi:MAG TPA: hypothetical protein VLE69_01315 [Candidatus Saccharimonadales bacterium]|nr:hypothetical protein [Candidatus Saccharimonadales bacterium]